MYQEKSTQAYMQRKDRKMPIYRERILTAGKALCIMIWAVKPFPSHHRQTNPLLPDIRERKAPGNIILPIYTIRLMQMTRGIRIPQTLPSPESQPAIVLPYTNPSQFKTQANIRRLFVSSAILP